MNNNPDKFELDSIIIYKLGIPALNSTEDIVGEITNVSLSFNYNNFDNSIEIDKISLNLKEMSPETQLAFKNFVELSTRDIEKIMEKEF